MVHNQIILFDGVCNFCDWSVQWLIKRDKKQVFRYASLQSEIGQKLLKQYQIDSQTDSVVYIRNGKSYIKSRAVFYILKDLKNIWSVIYVFKLLPTCITDFLYEQFARRRYAIFGKKTACMIPSKEQQSLFLS